MQSNLSYFSWPSKMSNFPQNQYIWAYLRLQESLESRKVNENQKYCSKYVQQHQVGLCKQYLALICHSVVVLVNIRAKIGFKNWPATILQLCASHAIKSIKKRDPSTQNISIRECSIFTGRCTGQPVVGKEFLYRSFGD